MSVFAVFSVGVVVGLVVGAFFAFLLGHRFLRHESRKLYDRWLRVEISKRRTWLNHLTHDLKNPLFLIQAFTWTYLEKMKKEGGGAVGPAQSKKMAEVLNQQAHKALEVLNQVSKNPEIIDEVDENKKSSSTPKKPIS